jgi:hypothetical protein
MVFRAYVGHVAMHISKLNSSTCIRYLNTTRPQRMSLHRAYDFGTSQQSAHLLAVGLVYL